MINLDIQMFLGKGQFGDISTNVTELDLVEEFGRPSEVEDYYEKGKYFHYENIRFSINESRVDYMDIFFMNTENGYGLRIDEKPILIDKNISVLRMLNILNVLEIEWKIESKQSNLDYLVIEVNSGIKIWYYFENEKLERMTKFFA